MSQGKSAQNARELLVTRFFKQNPMKEYSIADVATILSIDRDTASKYMAILEARGLLTKRELIGAKLKLFTLKLTTEEIMLYKARELLRLAKITGVKTSLRDLKDFVNDLSLRTEQPIESGKLRK